jgi:glutamate racemase
MPHPQAAILGCTHYPLMHDAFQKALGPKVKIFSQAGLVAQSLEDYLQRHPEKLGAAAATARKFLTTGDPVKVSQRATQFLKRTMQFEAA